jgi:hypothetical protein
MDMSKMSQGQMIVGVGGVLLLIGLFLDWVSLPFGGGNAFDAFSGMDIIMLIVAVLAIAWAVAGPAGMRVPGESAMIVGLLAVAMFGWALGWDLEFDNAGLGAWLALVGCLAIAWGALAGSRRPAVRAPVADNTSSTTSGPPPATPAV